MEDEKEKKNIIDEYLIRSGERGEKFDVLFRADDKVIDQMTELSHPHVINSTVLRTNDEFLMSKGIRPVYSRYLLFYMKHMVSLERKARGEYVAVNRDEEQREREAAGMRGAGGGLP